MTTRFSLWRSISVLALLSIGSQAIAFLSTTVMPLLFTPEVVGSYTTLLGLANLISPAITLTMTPALVVVRYRSMAQALSGAIALWIAVLALAFAMLIVFFSMIFPASATAPPRIDALLLGCVALPVSGLIALGQAWAIRDQQFWRVGLSTTLQSIAFLAILYPLARLVPGGRANSLVVGYALSTAAGGLVIWTEIAAAVEAALQIACRHRGILRWLLRRYLRYPGWWLPYSLIQVLYSNAPVLVLAGLYGAAEASFFGIAFRLTFAPFSVLPAALARVLFNELARDWPRLHPWRNLLQISFVACVFLHLPIVVALLVFGKWAVATFYGPAWHNVASYAAILVVPNLLMATLSGWDRFYDVCRAQKDAFFISLFVLVVSAIVLGGSALARAEARVTIELWAACQAILGILWYGRLLHNMANVPPRRWRDGATVLALGIGAIAVAFGYKLVEARLSAMTATAVGVVCYAAGLIFLWHRFWRTWNSAVAQTKSDSGSEGRHEGQCVHC
jgi:O-antigen/teichoic acid export membrane protein